MCNNYRLSNPIRKIGELTEESVSNGELAEDYSIYISISSLRTVHTRITSSLASDRAYSAPAPTARNPLRMEHRCSRDPTAHQCPASALCDVIYTRSAD